MTKKQWLALLGLYVTYLFVGACVFHYLEKEKESTQRRNDYMLYEKLIAAIKEYGLNESTTMDLENYCGRPLSENADLEMITPRLWDFYNSVFFVITVVSTVGYGNIHPTTPMTRTIMMFYAIIGIPMNGILLTSLAQFFSTVFIRAHKKYKRYESRRGLAVDVLKYLVPGILFFIFLPAAAFHYFEGWTYEESVYFAFVSLTTIGFGDMVAGQKPFKEFNSDIILIYKSLLLCWIIFGLGYLIMILGFITRAMRSKKMTQFEHKLVETLTHSKLWHGFSKDIRYLRRIMNEVYLDKFKPVYLDERQQQKHIFQRSKSLPTMVFGIDEENFFDPLDQYKRKRANSDYTTVKMKFFKVCSESDLHRIDRGATFASNTKILPDELIRHVVGVMGGSQRRRGRDLDDSRGVEGFSDDEILKSEDLNEGKDTSLSSINYPPPYEEAVLRRRNRSRALSECPPRYNTQPPTDNLEWTWSGTGSAKIFELVNERLKRLQINEKSRTRRLSSSIAAGMKRLNPRRKRKYYSESISESKKSVWSNGDVKAMGSVLSVQNESVELSQNGETEEGHYVTYTAGSGAQGIGLIHGKQGLSKPERSLMELYMSGDHLFSGNRSEAVEGTSLAEFLNVLSSLHNRMGTRRGGELLTTSSPQSLVDLFSPLEPTSSRPKSSERLQDTSNLKRLGRFLLRSYTKTDLGTDSVPPPRKGKSLPVAVPSDSYLADNYYTESNNPTALIAMDGAIELQNGKPKRTFSYLNVEDPPPQDEDTTRAANAALESFHQMRRGSTPSLATGTCRYINERNRLRASSEMVFPRQPSVVRWHPEEPYGVKPSLTDVKEIK